MLRPRELDPASLENPEHLDSVVAIDPAEGESADTVKLHLSNFVLNGASAMLLRDENGAQVELTVMDTGATMTDGRKIYTVLALEKI